MSYQPLINKTNQYKRMRDILLLAYSDDLDLVSFTTLFFSSEFVKDLENPSFEERYLNPILIYNLFLSSYEPKIKKSNNLGVNEDVVSFIAYFYSYFHFRTNEKYSRILKYVKPQKIIKNFDAWHTLSLERIIFDSKKEYNKKNSFARKRKKIISIGLESLDDLEILYLGKVLYLKLFQYQEIEDMVFENNGPYPLLINKEQGMLVSRRASSLSEIEDILNSKHLKKYLFLTNERIAVFFIRGFEVDETSFEEYLKKDVEERFDKILVYKEDKIFFYEHNEKRFVFGSKITLADYHKARTALHNIFSKQKINQL